MGMGLDKKTALGTQTHTLSDCLNQRKWRSVYMSWGEEVESLYKVYTAHTYSERERSIGMDPRPYPIHLA